MRPVRSLSHVLMLLLGAAVPLGCQQANAPSSAQRQTGTAPRKTVVAPRSKSKFKPARAGSEFEIGRSVSYANLTIFPVLSSTPRESDRFTTLDEGLRSGTVKIFEVGAVPNATGHDQEAAAPSADDEENPFGEDVAIADEERPFGDDDTELPEARGHDSAAAGNNAEVASPVEAEVAGDVNRLMLLNRSEKPLYLMPGEIIVGGKQDRTIAEETIIPPGETPVAISVFCVEHGRWSGRAAADYAWLGRDASSVSASGISDATVEDATRRANCGGFIACAGNLSKKARLTVQEGKGQQHVWDEVGEANAAAGLDPASGAFTSNYSEQASLQKLEPYLQELQSPIAAQKQVIGVVVAVNGKADSADLFESTPLFLKLWPKLLQSYALDAAVDPKPSADRVCTSADARSFLDKARKLDVQKTDANKGIVFTTRSADDIASFTSAAAEGENAESIGVGFGGGTGGAMGGGGFGGVHTSAFSK